MSTVMTNIELAKKLKDVAQNYKTLYVMGCFGAPMTDSNKTRYCNNHSYNKDATRTAMIKAASSDTFGFDCVCLIKGILWGWCGDKSKVYGGAGYAVNGVPDIGADSMIKVCSGVTTDFSSIEVGEAVWMSGHIGVYIGDGLAVECTPKWDNCVQITACNCSKSGYNRRNWTKHGKLPYVSYVAESQTTEPVSVTGTASTGSAADEKTIWNFLMSKIGNAFGVAGLMGNLNAESALRSNNLQNSYEKKLGYTDASYTAAVDNGSYTNFVKDSAGYGLAQWTYWTRKQNLLAYAQGKKKSVADLTTQLEFLVKELTESYGSVLKTLKAAKSVKEASDVVLTKFECPADQSDSVKTKRAGYGQNYYNKYASANSGASDSTPAKTSLAVGDVVNFKGTKHYTSSNATSPKTCKGGQAKVTAIAKGAKHPYHLIHTGSGCTVYGWVDEKDIAEISAGSWTPAVGDTVVYNGKIHYASANASSGVTCKGGKAKITQIYKLGSSKHPYHLVRVSGSGATVYGWVDAGTFTKA